jgi:hypothetical protein
LTTPGPVVASHRANRSAAPLYRAHVSAAPLNRASVSAQLIASLATRADLPSGASPSVAGTAHDRCCAELVEPLDDGAEP